MRLVDPVIVIPGITATRLFDHYPVGPESVWGILKKQFERVTLHPNNTLYELNEPARVKPGAIFDVAYEELIDELRYNLSLDEVNIVPVYPFSYDWRMPLEVVEQQLAEFVNEVIERTALMKHYHLAGFSSNPKVNLIGHSMGGLIISGYLQRYAEQARVNKVVTLATPFRGSFEAVVKVATGTANFGTSPPSSREREASRMTPALYHLLPSFHNGLLFDPGIPPSLYDFNAWQSSVIDTVVNFVKTRGLDGSNTEAHGVELFMAMLEQARLHRQRVNGLNLSAAGLSERDWLAVVGVDSKTRVGLKVVKQGDKVDFRLSSSDIKNQWQSANPSLSRLTGDGTVPFEGAVPGFLHESNLVCVTPDDFGTWELQDKLFTRAAGFHGILPNMNMIHRLIVRFFKGADDKRGNTWGRPAPGVENWQPPIDNLRNKNKQ